MIRHAPTQLFAGISDPFSGGRYHSLYAAKVPSFFTVTAKAGEIPMAIENSRYRIYGLQFHPESILTAEGSKIIENVLQMVKR